MTLCPMCSSCVHVNFRNGIDPSLFRLWSTTAQNTVELSKMTTSACHLVEKHADKPGIGLNQMLVLVNLHEWDRALSLNGPLCVSHLS